MTELKNYAVILASGSGKRYGADIPKQFIKISGKTILEHSIEAFEKSPLIDYIIVVITEQYRTLAEKIIDRNNYKKVLKIINGGQIRKDSSYNGVNAIDEKEANVLIHDCARPFVTQKIIQNCIEALKTYDAIGVAIPSVDTVIEVDENGIIKNIPKRTNMKCIQTPQGFKLSVIRKAHELSKNSSDFTDDCGLVVKNKLSDVYVVEGDIKNIKITYPDDILKIKWDFSIFQVSL